MPLTPLDLLHRALHHRHHLLRMGDTWQVIRLRPATFPDVPEVLVVEPVAPAGAFVAAVAVLSARRREEE